MTETTLTRAIWQALLHAFAHLGFEYTARRPNRAGTVRAHNWVGLLFLEITG
jgi:hypothetical protein